MLRPSTLLDPTLDESTNALWPLPPSPSRSVIGIRLAVDPVLTPRIFGSRGSSHASEVDPLHPLVAGERLREWRATSHGDVGEQVVGRLGQRLHDILESKEGRRVAVTHGSLPCVADRPVPIPWTSPVRTGPVVEKGSPVRSWVEDFMLRARRGRRPAEQGGEPVGRLLLAQPCPSVAREGRVRLAPAVLGLPPRRPRGAGALTLRRSRPQP